MTWLICGIYALIQHTSGLFRINNSALKDLTTTLFFLNSDMLKRRIWSVILLVDGRNCGEWNDAQQEYGQ